MRDKFKAIEQLNKKRRNTAILLTTHSMDEVEALASRMTIMVNGTLSCLGSVQHIREKYGFGYEIEFKWDQPGNLIKRFKINLKNKIHKEDLN